MTKKMSKQEELKNKLKELEEGWRRTQADFDNFKKKTETERSEIINLIKADFFAKIAPVLDNFSRASLHLDKEHSSDPVIQGFLQIRKQLEDILVSEGLTRIPTGGERFNPAIHEAISYEESNLPEGNIIDDVESGWAFQDKTIKPAKVRVSRGK